MNDRVRHCSWWQLWLLFPVLGILALLEVRAPLSPSGHVVVELGAVLILFGLIWAWVRANRVAMLREACSHMGWREVDNITPLPLESQPVAESDDSQAALEPAARAGLHRIDAAWNTQRG